MTDTACRPPRRRRLPSADQRYGNDCRRTSGQPMPRRGQFLPGPGVVRPCSIRPVSLRTTSAWRPFPKPRNRPRRRASQPYITTRRKHPGDVRSGLAGSWHIHHCSRPTGTTRKAADEPKMAVKRPPDLLPESRDVVTLFPPREGHVHMLAGRLDSDGGQCLQNGDRADQHTRQ